MSRLNLVSRGTLPAVLLLIGMAIPAASTPPPSPTARDQDGLILLPLEEEAAGRLETNAVATPTPGEVTLAAYGAPDGLVASNNGLLAVRFDPPFNAPYTITAISFPTRTQFRTPERPGRLISLRILGMDPLTGLPDKTVEYYQQRRVAVSSTGDVNTVPLEIAGSPGQTFFAVFQFPPPPASADSFPFLYTDRKLTEKGLFANSFATDTNATLRYPLIFGTRGRTIGCLVDSSDIILRSSGSFLDEKVEVGDRISGDVPAGTRVVSVSATTLRASNPVPRAKTTGPPEAVPASLGFSPTTTVGLLLDHNLICSMTIRLTGAAPLPAPIGLGLELSREEALWRFQSRTDVLADGTPAPSHALVANELVRRQDHVWTVIGIARGRTEAITLPRVPGGGFQIWGVRSVDRSGARSEISSVTISGTTSIQGYVQPVGEDAQEPNGMIGYGRPARPRGAVAPFGNSDWPKGDGEDAEDRNRRTHFGGSTRLATPVADLENTIWPAGDVDNFAIEAEPGQEISAQVRIPIGAYDFTNDLNPRLRLLASSGEVLAEAVGHDDPNTPVMLTYATPVCADDDEPRQDDESRRAVASGRDGETRRDDQSRHYIVQVSDAPGPDLAPGSVCRLLVPSRYDLSVDVRPILPPRHGDPAPAVGTGRGAEFLFARAGANPARGQVAFRYVIPREGQDRIGVRLRIYDLSGRVVHTLVQASQPAGSYSVAWSGRDARGEGVASGTYFARLEAGSHARTVRVEFVR